MLLALIFVLGVINVALGRAVLDSGHDLVAALPEALVRDGGRLLIAAEFVILLVAMLFAAHGGDAAVWVYGLYSISGWVGAWACLRG